MLWFRSTSQSKVIINHEAAWTGTEAHLVMTCNEEDMSSKSPIKNVNRYIDFGLAAVVLVAKGPNGPA